MRFTNFASFSSQSSFAGLDLASCTPPCNFSFLSVSNIRRGPRDLSSPPPPSNTPIIQAPDDDEIRNVDTTLIGSTTSLGDSATIISVTTSAATVDRDTFAVNARFPFVVRSSRWRSEATPIIVRHDAGTISTCTIINPAPRWAPQLPCIQIPQFTLPRLRLSWLRCPNRRSSSTGVYEDTHEIRGSNDLNEKDDAASHSKESEQDARALDSADIERQRTGLGWAGIFSTIGRGVPHPDFQIDGSGKLVVPEVDVSVVYRVTEEVETQSTDEDLTLLRIMSNPIQKTSSDFFHGGSAINLMYA